MKTEQKFKGQTLKRDEVVNRILSVYNDTTFEVSNDWYIKANELSISLGEKYNVSSVKVAGIIAALSPLKTWDENKKIAKSFLKNRTGKHTGIMLDKASQILDNDFGTEFIAYTLNGNKITSFFHNIAFPHSKYAVTIDRHAISICLGRPIIEKEGQITTTQYRFLEDCFKQASEVAGILPNQMQSVTWEKWRMLKKQDNFLNVPF